MCWTMLDDVAWGTTGQHEEMIEDLSNPAWIQLDGPMTIVNSPYVCWIHERFAAAVDRYLQNGANGSRGCVTGSIVKEDVWRW